MAGYIDKSEDRDKNKFFAGISSKIKQLASLGMKYDDIVVRQSRSVGIAEAEFGNDGFADEQFLYSLALTDIGNKKYIAYFDKELAPRIEFLNKFASNGEIEFILDTLCDDSIVYDEKNFFAYPSRTNLGDIKDEIFEKIESSFKKVYAGFKFNDDISAWNLFRKYLTTGFLAFEIIYDEKWKNIAGFKELDPLSLQPSIEKDSVGNYKKTWIQYPDNAHLRRELLDSQIIYISYASTNGKGVRISYLERLVRSFNLLRVIENSRVIWNIMNSTFRLKMVIPIGTKSKQKAKESLAELMSLYKEDINLDSDSGELSVNGKASMQFYKNYLIPQKNGENPEMETINGEGPDMTDSDILKYFTSKLQQDSKIPAGRFSTEAGGSTFNIGTDGIDRDEIRFSKFINRLRSSFQEILVKPVWLQLELEFPDIKTDEFIRNSMGLKFNKDNLFEELKNYDVQQKRLDMFNGFKDIMDTDGSTAYFDTEFLIKRFQLFADEDLETNEETKKERKKKAEKENGGPVQDDPLGGINI